MTMNKDKIFKDYSNHREWLDRIAAQYLCPLLNDASEEFHRQNPNIARPKYAEVRVKEFAKIIEKVERQQKAQKKELESRATIICQEGGEVAIIINEATEKIVCATLDDATTEFAKIIANLEKEKKQKKKEWEHEAIFICQDDGKVETIVNDVVAGKIVCATLDDVTKMVAILKEWSPLLSDVKGEEKFNKRTGYRAYHIDAKMEVVLRNKKVHFPVEIQVKTLLQDAWANFDHDELYKTSDEPPEITKTISRHIADALYALDQIGQTIRNEKLKKQPALPNIDDGEIAVTKRTLNSLIEQIFQTTLSDVELQNCVDQLKAFGFADIASVGSLVRDDRVVNEISIAKAQLRLEGEPTPYEIVYFGPYVPNGEADITVEMRRVYSLTDMLCTSCQHHLSEEEKIFVEEKTDLDNSKYFCKMCRVSRLRQCPSCVKLTELEICKDCLSQDSSTELI